MSETAHLAATLAHGRQLAAATIRRLAGRRAMQDPQRREQVQQILDEAPPDAVDHPPLRVIEQHGLSVRRGLSFRSIMIQRSEAARHAGVHDRAWRLDDKAAGYTFADALDVRRPGADLTPRPLADLTPAPGTVVKPARSTGARGVYLVHDRDQVVDVRANETITWAEATARARQLMAATTRTIRDRWITEELILDGGTMARDLKFFAFYGEVLFVQEIERLPTFRAAFWTPDGQRITTGKPDVLDDGHGVTKAQVALAEQISAQIPAPFVRLDMLRSGEKEAVLGEVTPRPGQFEEFDATTDRWMGEAWVKAERRLFDDALAGKQFDTFDQATHGR